MDFKYENYDYENKIPINKINEMLNILVPFYNGLNGKDNSKKEIYDPFINMVRNTKEYNILLCYVDKKMIGFINYMYQSRGLMLSEIQIIPKYQGKYNILRNMVKYVIDNSDKNKYKEIFLTINPKNTKSKEVFSHIGFKNVEGVLYKITYNDLIKWIGYKSDTKLD